MAETFASLSVKLSRAGVEYLLVGGAAVFLNGYTRSTFDLDLLVETSPANLHRLLDCLADFGEGAARELSVEDFDGTEGAVRINEDFTVDIFTVMRGKTFADFNPDARSILYDGQPIRFLSLDSLIELKAPSSREKDQLDVAMLRRIARGEEVAPSIALDEWKAAGAEQE